jgi:uncharacterized membrane protein YcaP (DUF421 family)
MGKREIGQLSPFDFVVAIIIAELAVLPLMNTDMPVWHSVLPLVTLVSLEVLMSYATLFNRSLRGIVCGHPQIIIRKGELLRKEMRKARYNLDDLLEHLRGLGVHDLREVEYAILETSGELSVILKSQHNPVTRSDLGLETEYEGLPMVLIMDGHVVKDNLSDMDLSEEWLERKLMEQGLSADRVLLAIINPDGELFISKK